MNTPALPAEKKPSTPGLERLIAVLFFCSGVPALTYQLVWQRALFSIFGVNMESVTVVVTAFMLGLGIGSLAGGWVSKRSRLHLLLVFATIEALTGVFGVISLRLFASVGMLTLGLPLYMTASVTLALVLVPTLLMGATLPILVEFFASRSGSVGGTVGQLYFVNTLGASAACLIATLLLFPFLGMQGSIYVAVGINFALAVGALIAQVSMRGAWSEGSAVARVPTASTQRLAFLPTLGLAYLGGFVSLSYELYFFRTVSFASGSSASAFGLTLGAFLLGLAGGARIAGNYCRTELNPSTVRRLLSMLFGAALLAFLFLPMQAAVSWIGPQTVGFAILLIYVQSLLWGVILPILAELGIPPDSNVGLRTGQIYLANILGSASGAILTGFVAMNYLTLVQQSTVLLALALVCTCLLALALPFSRHGRFAIGGVAAVMVAVAAQIAGPLNSGSLDRILWKNAPQPHAHVVQVVENRSGIIAVDSNGVVYGNGVYDGRFSTDVVHDSNGIVRPFALSLYHPAPRKLLMVGLASGSWGQVLANNPNVESLTVVEINPGYQHLIAQRAEVKSLLSNPKVVLITDDGRRWLRQHPDRRFDAVIMNTTFHFRANATNLLSVEFLNQMRGHLLPGGTLFYNTTESARVQRTGCLVFPHGMRIGNHLLVSIDPISLNFARWREVLLRTSIDGRPVIDPSRAEDSKALDGLMALESGGQAYGPGYFEPCAAILARTATLASVTDDNMGTEWRYPLGLQ